MQKSERPKIVTLSNTEHLFRRQRAASNHLFGERDKKSDIMNQTRKRERERESERLLRLKIDWYMENFLRHGKEPKILSPREWDTHTHTLTYAARTHTTRTHTHTHTHTYTHTRWDILINGIKDQIDRRERSEFFFQTSFLFKIFFLSLERQFWLNFRAFLPMTLNWRNTPEQTTPE